jgi:PAS domain S-box-containing protein
LGYAIAIAALVINAIFTFWNLNSIRVTWDTLDRGRDFVRGIDGVLSSLKDAETGQRGFLLTGDERYLEPYQSSHHVIAGLIDGLRFSAGARGSSRARVETLAGAAEDKLAELAESIAVRRERGLDAALAIVKTDRGKDTMDRLRGALAEMRAEEDRSRAVLRARLQTAIIRTMVTFSFASAVALLLLFGVHFLSERSRDQLRRQAAWLSTTLRSIGDAVIATDSDGRVIFMNGVAEGLTGWTQRESVGRPLAEVFHILNEETRKLVENPVNKVLKDGAVVGLANHTALIARDGTEHAIDDTAAPICDDGGEIKGVVLVFHDVGARRQLERALHDRTVKLIDADHRKDEFLAMLAHELRNPIGTISNAIQLLKAPIAKEHAEWSKDVIERQVQHLARLIDDLLDVSRITRGKIELRKERIDAAHVIESAVEAVRPLFDERRHKVEVSYNPGTLWVDADPTRLEQTFVNLLTNAAKYTEAGGRISVIARKEDERIAFKVKDNGAGIPAEKLPEMFELFAQGDRTIARSEGGLGVGLTIVKLIAELHGGTVSASSEGPGRGSEFTVLLPAAPQPITTGGGGRAAQPHGTRFSRILVIDDNVDNANGLSRLLKLLGHDVSTVHDGHAAIPAALAFRPEFILLDIGLPGMDGYEVARQLRCHERFRDTVIIAISGYGQEEDRLRSQAAGFDYHMVKPVDYQALITLIGQT